MRKLKDDLSDLDKAVAAVERRVQLANRVTVVLVTVGAAVGIGAIFRFSGSQEGISLLGDLLSGTTGTLWALAGLMLVYVAFLGQQLAILHQKEDLRLTREALMDQRREMETQTQLFENQQFETTFFALLSSHQDLVNNCEIEMESGTKRGAPAFANLADAVRAQFAMAREANPATPSIDVAKKVYMQQFRKYEQTLGPYFHSLFHILKFVDDRHLPIERVQERRKYTNLVRARLSISELVLLFYGGISEQGAGMRMLIERYSVLKHLSTSRLLDREHRLVYKTGAWARPMSQDSMDRTNEHRARKKRRLTGQTGENMVLSRRLLEAPEETVSEPVSETVSGMPAPTEELGRQASNLQPPG